MRDLIKPTLFIVARLALFLAVVAWIVGQWWNGKVACPFGTTLLTEHGWSVQPQGRTNNWRLSVKAIESESPATKLVNDWKFNTVDAVPNDPERFLTSVYPRGSSMSELPGIVVINTPFISHWSVSFRHWLIATIFATFNICLHWFYRKRLEVQPCEN